MVNTIAILGNGNVANYYYNLMKQKGLRVEKFSSRKPFSSVLWDFDLIIIAVKDEAIKQVVREFTDFQGLLVHTSGSVTSVILSEYVKRFGVFYPLQSIKQGIANIDNALPLCVWANNQEDRDELLTLAEKLTKEKYLIDDKQRESLHLAGVFANNFTNHILGIAKEILDKEDLPFEMLFPLIDKTIASAKSNNPYSCQTGPAIRGDHSIMQKHLNRLDTLQQEIYKSISNNIIKHKLL